MSVSFGDKLNSDPRVQEAKALILEALNEHKAQITGVKDADQDLKESYEGMLSRMSDVRGRALYIPYLSSGLGSGALIELADGSVKYDFITGIGVHYLGHSHPKVIEASIDAALQDSVMQGNLQQDVKSLELMEKFVGLVQKKGASLKHCFLSTSGAMANENAFKIIFQKHSPAHRLLAFERCFTGRSLACAQMTNKPENRVGIPQVLEIDYIPFYDAKRPQESKDEAIKTLKEFIHKNKGEYAGMCFELVQGEGGYYPGESSFFIALMEILKENNIAVMVDEIQTFGRTEEAFAFQYFGLDQYMDVVTVGKCTQACAMIFTESYNPKPGLLSQTFSASTAAIHTACLILDELEQGAYLGPDGKIAQLSNHFVKGLESLSKKYPKCISGPYGLGAMVGITPFEGSLEKTKAFMMDLYHAGVMGFMAGKEPTRARFLMPIGAVTREDIDNVCDIIEGVIKK